MTEINCMKTTIIELYGTTFLCKVFDQIVSRSVFMSPDKISLKRMTSALYMEDIPLLFHFLTKSC